MFWPFILNQTLNRESRESMILLQWYILLTD